LLEGAVQVTIAEALAAVAETPVGAPGAVIADAGLNGDLGSVLEVSVDPLGLKKFTYVAVRGQLEISSMNRPLAFVFVYAADVLLNISSIFVHAVGVHCLRPAAVKEAAPKNIPPIFITFDTFQLEMFPLKLLF